MAWNLRSLALVSALLCCQSQAFRLNRKDDRFSSGGDLHRDDDISDAAMDTDVGPSAFAQNAELEEDTYEGATTARIGWCLPHQQCNEGDCCAQGSSCYTCPHGWHENHAECAGKGNRRCNLGGQSGPDPDRTPRRRSGGGDDTVRRRRTGDNTVRRRRSEDDDKSPRRRQTTVRRRRTGDDTMRRRRSEDDDKIGTMRRRRSESDDYDKLAPIRRRRSEVARRRRSKDDDKIGTMRRRRSESDDYDKLAPIRRRRSLKR